MYLYIMLMWFNHENVMTRDQNKKSSNKINKIVIIK